MLSIFKYEVLWHEVIIHVLMIFSQVHVYILHTTLLPDVNPALHTKSNGGHLPNVLTLVSFEELLPVLLIQNL